MNNCLVCWEHNIDTVSSRIYIKLRVWKEYNVQQIIEKHLSWWHLRQSKNKNDEPWICLKCWQELLSFHKFYERVETINRNLPSVKSLKNNPEIGKNQQDAVMMESICSDNEDLSSPKRKRLQKNEKPENIQIEEFTIVDVKTDPNIFIPETAMEDPFQNMDSSTKCIGIQTNLVTVDATEFKEEIRGLINTEIKSLRRGIQHDLSKLEDKLIPFIPSSNSSEENNSKRISEFKDMLNIHEPFNDLQTFYEFENKIRSDKECVDAMRELISIKIRTKTLTDAIGAAVSMVITPELQMRFSACGKPNKGIAKENFSATKTYTELKDYLLNQFGNETEATILSKTSRWLATAKDRYMGRSSR